MIYGYWRNRFGEWQKLNKYATIDEAKGTLATYIASQKIQGTYEWNNYEYVSTDGTAQVRAVITITPMNERELSECYPAFNAPIADVPEGKQRYFLSQLTPAQRTRLSMAEEYQRKYSLGSPEFDDWVLIAKLATLLDSTETELDSEKAKKSAKP